MDNIIYYELIFFNQLIDGVFELILNGVYAGEKLGNPAILNCIDSLENKLNTTVIRVFRLIEEAGFKYE